MQASWELENVHLDYIFGVCTTQKSKIFRGENSRGDIINVEGGFPTWLGVAREVWLFP